MHNKNNYVSSNWDYFYYTCKNNGSDYMKEEIKELRAMIDHAKGLIDAYEEDKVFTFDIEEGLNMKAKITDIEIKVTPHFIKVD